MARVFLWAVALCVVTAFGGSANAMELREALETAYRNSLQLKAARAELEAAFENYPQAYSGWLPSITGSYSTGKERQKTGTSTANEYHAPHSRSVSLSQPIFSGGRTTASIQRAEYLVDRALARYTDAEQDLLSSALVAYVDVVRTRKVLELSKSNERVLEEQLEATRSRFDLGETTRTDVAQSESRLARAQSDRIQAEGNLIASESEFERVYLIAPPATMNMPEALGAIPGTLDNAMQVAFQKNPSLLTALNDHLATKTNIDIQQADLLPTVSIDGQATRQGGETSRLGGSFESDTILLNVSVPFFQNGSEYSQIRQAKKEEKNAFFSLSQTRKNLVDGVRTAWQDIHTSLADLSANLKAVEAAELALEGVKEEREIGSRTVLDVLNAEQELFVARVDLITSQRNNVVATYNLKATVGELTAQDIDLAVPYYDRNAALDRVKYQMIGF